MLRSGIDPTVKIHKPTAAEQLDPGNGFLASNYASKHKGTFDRLEKELTGIPIDVRSEAPTQTINLDVPYTHEHIALLVDAFMTKILPYYPIMTSSEIKCQVFLWDQSLSTLGSIVILSMAALGESITSRGDQGLAKSRRSSNAFKTYCERHRPELDQNVITFRILSMLFSLRRSDRQTAMQTLNQTCLDVRHMVVWHKEGGYSLGSMAHFLSVSFWICRLFEA